MSQVTNRSQKKSHQKRDEKSEEDSSDEKTDDFSEEELDKLEAQKKEETQKTMRNVPIAVATLSNAKVRTIYTLIMLFCFILIVSAGAFYCALLITTITAGIFREIINLKRKTQREYKIPFFNMINWYFFFVGVFYFYGAFYTSKISEETSIPDYVRSILNYHKFASFSLWIIGFLVFVLSLTQGFYRYQFRLFGWTHLTILIVVAQTSVIVSNLYQGLVWFILPALLVISNDIFAYIFGKLFGKTKLIQLSPNKTWEGFIGGFFSSLFFAVLFSYIFQNVPFLICQNDIQTITPFVFKSCQVDSFYIPSPLTNQFFSQTFPFNHIQLSEFQVHSLYLSLFASLIAPFGGFFASGFKRALKVKDFGTSIPGHGGLTDRMDCQLLMGTFTFCYLNYIVIGSVVSVIASINSNFKSLSLDNQAKVLEQLKKSYEEKMNQSNQIKL
ncbi:phosphatidate cytidylyltransferase (macronuclear) [Tetrahymena thermophila SB210]|uniref:Phosphatidate cytidylyltransferase n=1 Tax=Tetrahymena thermophila (strain SB210) TaxID=312017 RepID=I7M0E3_TETTS|nr:phosphatidate cytidylyltransferase [Tetrahymena thermophila SB210]EAR87408.3 phosphatidate cytidylyltransferase [Tetrahymena thermophila SB210]|eukprot:XP_001007653.3 phosphatidate cytidylyltransferase [Tetrahymena thermophila SB210]